MDELQAVIAQQPGAYLVNLEKGKIAADAEVAPSTKL